MQNIQGLIVWGTLVVGLHFAKRFSLAAPDVISDPPQDIVALPVLAQIVSGSEGGFADGIYGCVNSESTCAHLHKPQLRLEEEEVTNIVDSSTEKKHMIFDGSALLYFSERREKNDTLGETTDNLRGRSVWVYIATDPPQASALTVATVHDSGCPDLLQKGRKEGNTDAVNEAKQLGDVYTDVGRFAEAMKCYSAAAKATLPGQQHCSLKLAACAMAVKQAEPETLPRRTFSGEREEAECLLSLLQEEGGNCSAADTAYAHLTIGVFRLSEEWDVSKALEHFFLANRQPGELQYNNFEWGAVWLVQAIQGSAKEALIGFTANVTAFGEVWGINHLRSWRRYLGKKCSGIGMTEVFEGAERLILASAQLGDGNGLSSNAIEIHLTLSRALVLQGAFDEAKAHAHAAEELMPVEGRGRGIGGGSGFNTDSIDISALHLEIALLSRTPVVTESWDQVTSLREGLLGELDRLGKENSFRYSISRPLEVGVRAQFLATYQGLNDKAVAMAFAAAFHEASGRTLMYHSPRLLRAHAPGDGRELKMGTISPVTTFINSEVNGGTPHQCDAQEETHFEHLDMPTTKEGVQSVWLHPNKRYNAADTREVGVQETEELVAGVAATGSKEKIAAETRVTKVGFLSVYFRWHSVGRLTVGLLEKLSQSSSLEIFIIDASADGIVAEHPNRRENSPSKEQDSKQDSYQDSETSGASSSSSTGEKTKTDSIRVRLGKSGASIVRISPTMGASLTLGEGTTSDSSAQRTALHGSGIVSHSLRKAQEKIAALHLDALVFSDVGMDALTTELAHSRLSPVQVAFWGHPGTTGLPTVDYFVTSDLFEGESSEKKICQNATQRQILRGTCHCGGGAGKKKEPQMNGATHDQAKDLDKSSIQICPAGEVPSRQKAFSEQLVRLGGLGVIFDDPIQTFQTDPKDTSTYSWLKSSFSVGESSVGQSGQVEVARKTSHYGQTRARNTTGHRECSNARSNHDTPHVGDYDQLDITNEENGRPRLYVCAQSLMKMHPAFDSVLAGILAKDPLAQIALLRDSRQLLWHSRFRRRLRAAVDHAEDCATAAHFEAAAKVNATIGTDPLRRPISSVAGNPLNFPTNPPSSTPPPAKITSANSAVPHRNSTDFPVLSIEAAIDLSSAQGGDPQSQHHKKYQQVLSLAPGRFWSRVRFLNPMSGGDFFRLQCRADVVLDPFPFGGGVTIMEALACGTPVITAGALQSVHRLAEGMITAAATGAALASEKWDDADSRGETFKASATKACSNWPGAILDAGPSPKTISNTGTGGRKRSDKNVMCVGSEDGCTLVDNLVATTLDGYISKAIGVATPGTLRGRVRRELRRGHDRMLQGDGNVAMDWEKFLRNAAALSTIEDPNRHPP